MKRLYIPIIIFLFITSCSKTEEKSTTAERLGKYIYRDDNDIYHTKSDCMKLRRGKDDAGHEIYAKHLIDTSCFVIPDTESFRVCSRCVNDEEYEHLIKIYNRNEERNQKRNTIIQAKRWLYDKLVQANYEMPDYEVYLEGLNSPKIRNQLYLIAQKEGWDVGENEGEFSKLLGFE